MFKKGFLNKGTQASRTVPIKPTITQLEDEGPTPFGALPIELIITIVDHLVSPREASTQRDLASLRCASKHFSRIVTPHLYSVLQLSNSAIHASLITPLQLQPKLCDYTRAIWWDEWYGADRLQPIVLYQPYLCKFVNVQDVAYFINVPISSIGSPMGLHLALREVGEWCQGVKLPAEYIHKQQCTPTIRTQPAHDAPTFKVDEPTRAVWALRLIVPTLSGEMDMFYGPPKTLMHLTIDVFDHPDIPIREDSVPLILSHILDKRTLPLLKHLTIRVLDFGRPPYGLPTQEDIAAARGQHGSQGGLGLIPIGERNREAVAAAESEQWELKTQTLLRGIQQVNDPRVHFEAIKQPHVTRSRTRLEDVRKHTLALWQERVFRGGPGPWRWTEA